MAGAKSGNVEVRTLQAEILGTFFYVGFGVERLLLGDQDLLWLWRDKGRFLGMLENVRSRFWNDGFFLTLYFGLCELVESSSLLEDGVSGFRTPFTVVLDNCGSTPRLC